MSLYTIPIKSTKSNQQTPHTQICNWVKATPAAPWTTLTIQPSNKSIMVQVNCELPIRDQLQELLTAAVAYSDAHWGPAPMNPACISELAAAYPNPLAPETLAFLQA